MKLLDTKEDCQWLRETHLAGHRPLPFRSFILQGNEDSPDRLSLFASKSPRITDEPTEFFTLDRESGAYIALHSKAENLDGFLDSAELNKHAAALLEENAGILPGWNSPVPRAYLAYISRKARAIDCRKAGLIEEARTHEEVCESIYANEIPALWRW